MTFKNGSATLGTVTLSGGVAQYTTSALTKASHTIKATYSGTADFKTQFSDRRAGCAVGKSLPGRSGWASLLHGNTGNCAAAGKQSRGAAFLERRGSSPSGGFGFRLCKKLFV